MRAFAAGVVLLAGCDTGAEPAWLLAQTASLDGGTIARAWCPDRCDVPGKTVLTLSPANRAVAITPSEVEGFPATGDLPAVDVAATLYAREVLAGTGAMLTWTGARAITIALPCPSDGNLRAVGPGTRFRDIAVTFRDNAPGGRCG